MNWSQFNEVLGTVLIALMMLVIPVYAIMQRVKLFPSFFTGTKQGAWTALRIAPYLVGFLVALGMFRAAGGFTLLQQSIGFLFKKLGFPVELLPLALVRPFSGGAANGFFAELTHQYGGHSFMAHAAATMMGSTETTFYVLVVYFGAVGIKRVRHAILAGLIADAVGIIAAIAVTYWFYQ